MSIKIRPYVKSVIHAPGCVKNHCGPECKKELDGYEYDIRFAFPNGHNVRERKRVPLDTCTKNRALEWAERRERELWAKGPPSEMAAAAKMTIDELAAEWQRAREARELMPHVHTHYRVHIKPRVGHIKIGDFKQRDALAFAEYLLAAKTLKGERLANGTIRQIYYALCNMFSRAVTRGYLDRNPVVIEQGILPTNTDKDLEWRDTARFTPSEVALMISSPYIPSVRRVVYALQFLTGMRPGEAAALRWCDYDPSVQPLGKFKVNRAFNSRQRKVKSTKTGRARFVPAHPVLATILDNWKRSGWKEWMGRDPVDTDLIIPNRFGNHRQSPQSLRTFHRDLVTLGLRKRRQYDTRRTFISMALDGGANYVHAMYLTHAPPQQEFWKYVTHEWESLCRVMACIVIPVPSAAVSASDEGVGMAA